jgi:hypothetical protein
VTPLVLVRPVEVDVADDVDDVDDVEPEEEVEAVVAWVRDEAPGMVTALTTLSVPTAATEPKAMPAVRRLSIRNARSRARTLFCISVGVSMSDESGGRG